jgi:hypothetical protein
MYSALRSPLTGTAQIGIADDCHAVGLGQSARLDKLVNEIEIGKRGRVRPALLEYSQYLENCDAAV